MYDPKGQFHSLAKFTELRSVPSTRYLEGAWEDDSNSSNNDSGDPERHHI